MVVGLGQGDAVEDVLRGNIRMGRRHGRGASARQGRGRSMRVARRDAVRRATLCKGRVAESGGGFGVGGGIAIGLERRLAEMVSK